MNTKVIILGHKTSEQPPKKKIEFIQSIDAQGYMQNYSGSPNHPHWNISNYNYIELVAAKYGYFNGTPNKYDIMFAYNDPNNRSAGILFLGYFNDGAV